MLLEIITPDKSIFSGEATSVTLPGADGSLGILDNHIKVKQELLYEVLIIISWIPLLRGLNVKYKL